MAKSIEAKNIKFEKEINEVCSKIRELVGSVKDQKHIAMKAYYVFLDESKEETKNE